MYAVNIWDEILNTRGRSRISDKRGKKVKELYRDYGLNYLYQRKARTHTESADSSTELANSATGYAIVGRLPLSNMFKRLVPTGRFSEDQC